MKRFLVSSLVFIGALTLLAPAAAQKPKAKTYKSAKGYAIRIPAGWVKVSGDAEIPAALRKRAEETGIQLDNGDDEERFVTGTPKDGEFLDNIGIQVQEPVVLNDEAVEELKKVLVPAYKKIFGDFKLVKFERQQFGIHDGIRIVGAYRLQGFEVVMEQGVIMTPKASVIVTCSMGRARQLEVRRACQDSFNSVSFN